MPNLLLETPEFQITETRLGVWRRYLYPTGASFSEFRSHGTFLGLPLLHYTRGISPATGRRVVAKGILAVGRVALGVVAVGQAAAGVVTFAQAGLGLAFALGQAAAGWWAVGQLALGAGLGIGQLATGAVAVGQLAYGRMVLAQLGHGQHAWTPAHADPEAVAFFHALWDQVRAHLGTLAG